VNSSKDIRSQRVAFVPFCLVCQAFQAEGIVRNHPAIVKPILQVLMENDINIIQMPCPESLFGGLEHGLGRRPQSHRKYDTPEFREFCGSLADGVLHTVKALLNKGLQVVAILGIEYSPSCAVNYQFEGRTVHRQGIFIRLLGERLQAEGTNIPFVGINRRGVRPAEQKLKELLSPQLGLGL